MNAESSQEIQTDKIKEIFSSSEKNEEKIEKLLDFMRDCLSQEDAPLFKEFWEARKVAIPLYKEVPSSYARSTLWQQLVDLTQQAKRIREILDEKSAFHVEQIEIAIKAIDEEVKNFDKILSELDVPVFSSEAIKKNEEYVALQKRLDLLTAFASRLASLRKEILATDMRMRKKNALLKEIASLQDQIIPQRKELMKEVSKLYEKDVDAFASRYFQEDKVIGLPFFKLKEEIKAFQADGKRLTLTPDAFSHTRTTLSKCWDQIKEISLERKKEKVKIQEKEEGSLKECDAKIAEIEKALQEELPLQEVEQKTQHFLSWLKAQNLSRDSIRRYSKKIDVIKKEINRRKESIFTEEKEKLLTLQNKILEAKSSKENLAEKKDSLSKELAAITLGDEEKEKAFLLLRQLEDLVQAQEEDKKLQENPGQIENILQQKRDRASSIKQHIDELKKKVSTSNLDFAKAMVLREMIDSEKERLATLHEQIESLEEE